MTEPDNKQEKYMDYIVYKQEKNKAGKGTKGSMCGGICNFK